MHNPRAVVLVVVAFWMVFNVIKEMASSPPPARSTRRATLVDAAVSEGRLRVATERDFADFELAYSLRYTANPPQIAQHFSAGFPAYVIVDSYSFYSENAAGHVFLLARGAPQPLGMRYAAALLDIANGTCHGRLCEAMLGLKEDE